MVRSIDALDSVAFPTPSSTISSAFNEIEADCNGDYDDDEEEDDVFVAVDAVVAVLLSVAVILFDEFVLIFSLHICLLLLPLQLL